MQSSEERPRSLFPADLGMKCPRFEAMLSTANDMSRPRLYGTGNGCSKHFPPSNPMASLSQVLQTAVDVICVKTWSFGVNWTLEHVEIHTPKESRVSNFVLKFLTILIGCVHLLCLSRFDLGHATDRNHTSKFRGGSLFPWFLWGCRQAGHRNGPI